MTDITVFILLVFMLGTVLGMWFEARSYRFELEIMYRAVFFLRRHYTDDFILNEIVKKQGELHEDLS